MAQQIDAVMPRPRAIAVNCLSVKLEQFWKGNDSAPIFLATVSRTDSPRVWLAKNGRLFLTELLFSEWKLASKLLLTLTSTL